VPSGTSSQVRKYRCDWLLSMGILSAELSTPTMGPIDPRWATVYLSFVLRSIRLLFQETATFVTSMTSIQTLQSRHTRLTMSLSKSHGEREKFHVTVVAPGYSCRTVGATPAGCCKLFAGITRLAFLLQKKNDWNFESNSRDSRDMF
jgi:hypothetical protein